MGANEFSRRELVGMLGVLGVGAAATLVARGETAPAHPAAGAAAAPAGETKKPSTLWVYKPLDPVVTAERAFAGYGKGHCMYGAFESIVGQLGDMLGEPYKNFPFDMLVYGAGGVSGWATLCGSLNGAAAAFQLLSPKPEAAVDELFGWYQKEALGNYVPKNAKFPNVASVAGSPLCHASISKWCAASGKKSYSPERKERCGVITASVAKKAVEILNAQAAGPFSAAALPAATQKCMSCHEKGGMLENARTKMDCGGCHFALGSKHVELP